MNKNQSHFTTARLLTKTKLKVSRARLQYGFKKIEDATDYFINLGLKTHRELIKEQKNGTV